MASIRLTPSVAIKGLLDLFTSTVHGLKKVVFDPSLSVDMALKNVRTVEPSTPVTSKDMLPVLIWNRSPLRKSDAGRRFNNKFMNELDGRHYNIKGVPGVVEIRFAIATNTAVQMETLELDFYSASGYAAAKTLKVTLGSLGDFTFSVEWGTQLDDLTLNVDGIFYQTISGVATLSGVFFEATEISEEDYRKIIKEVVLSVMDCKGETIIDGITVEASEEA